MLPTSLFAYVRCVSSADIVGSLFKKHFGRSFMYNKPRIVPWGTLQVSTRLSDKDSPTEHCCVSFSKYDWKHLNEFLDITWRSRLDRRMLSGERYRKLSLNLENNFVDCPMSVSSYMICPGVSCLKQTCDSWVSSTKTRLMFAWYILSRPVALNLFSFFISEKTLFALVAWRSIRLITMVCLRLTGALSTSSSSPDWSPNGYFLLMVILTKAMTYFLL